MIIDEIIANKRAELAEAMQRSPLDRVAEVARRAPLPLSLASAIRGRKVKLIAEVKKASPSRGVICKDFDPVRIASSYAENGVAAISVLTESKYFQGSLSYLQSIKYLLKARKLPLIRKDFVIHPYQVYEARAYGADSLLLISYLLDKRLLDELLTLAAGMGMDCLVEVHNEGDLQKALECGAKIIGINNRDLRTFKVDLSVTKHLRPLVPQDRLVVSESGIYSAEDIALMRGLRVNAVLIGEALTASPDIGAKIRELFA